MTDSDTGQPMLIASSDPQLGDLQEVTSTQQLAPMAAAAHAEISRAVQLAADHQAAIKPCTDATGTPRTWSTTDRDTGQPLNVTCMVGCNITHEPDLHTPGPAAEILCASYDQENTTELPVGCGADDTPSPVLSTQIQVQPFHPDPARRLPHAAVQVMEDHYIEDLDPDGLAAVIDHFEQRVAAMRVRHTELVRTRAEYLGRQA
ncbi:hypothetical protein H9W91_17575 [Streptomyces alfalfae]|uniref:DUF6907 domain-containing protein n=1 Tax=Streptomyces alfalfae TaxID=1642299 RepID=UPI001BA45477|nr:hypothetical protein [Streptomyces alfalfae]QUI32470.1 hypothetical protein H9W91_17575 [Streptomyces alfalfae]